MTRRGDKERIAVAEADSKVAIVVETSLKKANYDVVLFDDPDELLAELSTNIDSFSAVVIDMPNAGVPTLALASSIAEIDEDFPQVLILSSAEDKERAESIPSVKSVLIKPLAIKDLVNAVNIACGREVVEEKAPKVKATPSEKPSYGKKVLVVDDAGIILKSVKLVLERAGFDVITAENGKIGLMKVIAEKPDLVISDIMMPEKDGFELLSDIRSNPKIQNIPVIMLTAKGYKDDILKAVNMKVTDYIVKPFSPHVLVDRVKKALNLS